MSIQTEIKSFLDATGYSARRLALEAGVAAPVISRVVSGARKGMHIETADKVRDAIIRLSPELSHSSAHGARVE